MTAPYWGRRAAARWTDARATSASGVIGRATGVADRAQRSVVAYDDRGDGIWTGRQIAVIPTSVTFTTAYTYWRPRTTEVIPAVQTYLTYDDSHTYEQTAYFDHAGRGRAIVLPRDPDWGGTGAPDVVGTMAFQRRGLPHHASVGVDCSVDVAGVMSCSGGGFEQPVVAGIEHTRDGLPSRVTYGDDGALAGTGGRPPRAT